jgi:hypothetical protein
VRELYYARKDGERGTAEEINDIEENKIERDRR